MQPHFFGSNGGQGVFAKPLLHHKTLGGVDQFLQVLNAVKPFAFAFVVLHQATVLEHQGHDVFQGEAGELLAHHIDLGHKSLQMRTGFARHKLHTVVQR